MSLAVKRKKLLSYLDEYFSESKERYNPKPIKNPTGFLVAKSSIGVGYFFLCDRKGNILDLTPAILVLLHEEAKINNIHFPIVVFGRKTDYTDRSIQFYRYPYM